MPLQENRVWPRETIAHSYLVMVLKHGIVHMFSSYYFIGSVYAPPTSHICLTQESVWKTQAGWFHSWTWLHYHEATDSAFLFYMCKGNQREMSSGNADTAFVSNRDRDYSCILWHVFIIILLSISKYKRSYIARL